MSNRFAPIFFSGLLYVTFVLLRWSLFVYFLYFNEVVFQVGKPIFLKKDSFQALIFLSAMNEVNKKKIELSREAYLTSNTKLCPNRNSLTSYSTKKESLISVYRRNDIFRFLSLATIPCVFHFVFFQGAKRCVFGKNHRLLTCSTKHCKFRLTSCPDTGLPGQTISVLFRPGLLFRWSI